MSDTPYGGTGVPESPRSSLQSGQFNEDMIPTVGFNMRKITKGNVTIKVRTGPGSRGGRVLEEHPWGWGEALTR